MDSSPVVRQREFGLVREADKVRTVIVVFCALFLAATPSSPGGQEELAWAGLGIAAFFTLLTRFLVDWERLEAYGATPTAAALVLIGDVAWLMLFVAGTGGFGSPFSMLLLVVILFAGVFFGSLPLALPLTTAVMVTWYGGAAAVHGLTPRDSWVLAAQVISAVAVGWLGWALNGVLERERQTSTTIVRSLTEGVLLVNEQGIIVLANPRATELLGPGAPAVTARSVWDESLAPDVRAVLEDIRETPPPSMTVTRLVEVGEGRDLRVSAVPCPVGLQGHPGWVIVLEDVTELRAAARMKEEGLALASHELRSPLATLGALSQVLDQLGEQMDEGQKAQAVAALREETRRLGRLVSALLDVGHLERGAYTLSPELLDPGELVCSVARTLARRAADRDLRVDYLVEPDLPRLWADPTRLELVLTNLGENALKYTPEGGRVWLTARRRGEQVSLVVEDTGPGIPKAEQEVIFEKYSRGSRHQATYGRQGGLGLGLYMARRIVELHGGELRLESMLGEGSSFEVLLPPAEAPALRLAA